jgi:hypothetical protein
MLWINEELVSYDKAINALNFDKLGHETGLGSWGVLVEIEDGFSEPLLMFLGVKFDVLSIITNRFVTSFINIPRNIKEKVQKTKKGSGLNRTVSGVSNFTPDITADTVMEFYVDTHKVSIDVAEMMNTVYQYVDTTAEYGALARDRVFLSGGRRASRAVSASMLRVYDGNLENFGFIFTRERVEFVLNEMIIPDSIIHDEIKYTFWLTPHDREEYKFLFNDGDVPVEPGSEFIDGLGVEKTFLEETNKLYQYDRRGMRNGYYDVSIENPIVNHGYFDGNIEVSDTFQFAEDTSSRFHKHKSQVSLDAGFQQHVSSIAASLMQDAKGSERMRLSKIVFEKLIKMSALSIFKANVYGSFTAELNRDLSDGKIEKTIRAIGTIIPNIPQRSISQAVELSTETTVIPLSLLNKITDLRAINIEEVKNSIIFIYHPVVDKFVFYEMGHNDPAEITSSSIRFMSDGTQYGIDLRGSYPVFIWSNFEKRFRENISTWVNILGEKYPIGKKPGSRGDAVEQALAETDSGIPLYDDMTFEGKSAKIIAVNKDDVREIIRKTRGVVHGDFVFGMKTGDIEIVRDGLWM